MAPAPAKWSGLEGVNACPHSLTLTHSPNQPGLKIYPTLVIRGTGLYELWKTGRYKNYTPDELVDLVAKILAMVPPWTRVYRIQRSAPCCGWYCLLRQNSCAVGCLV